MHRKLKGKRRILSFGIGNGITENELLCFDNHYKIDGIDFFRDPNWDSRISHKKTIDECNNNEYEAILFNSSIYNFSDKDLEELLSEIKVKLSSESTIICWEQDLPPVTNFVRSLLSKTFFYLKNKYTKRVLTVFWVR